MSTQSFDDVPSSAKGQNWSEREIIGTPFHVREKYSVRRRQPERLRLSLSHQGEHSLMVEPHYVIVQSAGSIPAVLDTKILKVSDNRCYLYPFLYCSPFFITSDTYLAELSTIKKHL